MKYTVGKIGLLLALSITSIMIFDMPSFSASKAKQDVIKSQVSHSDLDEHDEIFRRVVVKDGDVLSITDCVSVAFNNSPVIRRYKYNLDVARSNVGIAKSEYFPVINAGVGFYNENHSNSREFDSHYRQFPGVALTVNQLVYNFGKTTSYIKMEEFYKIGAEYEFMDSLCETLFDVKEKYYALLLAQAKLHVEKRNFELNEEFLDIAEKLAKKDILRAADVTSARFNYNSARVKYLEAQNDLRNAKIDLSNAMYLTEQVDFSIKDTDTFSYKDEFIKSDIIKEFVPEPIPFTKQEAVKLAYDNSPDLKVLIATFKAMEQSLNYIKKTYLPDLTANAGYGYNYANTYRSDGSIQVGVGLNSSVNLMNLRHSIKGAEAQLNFADNEIVLFKKDLYFRVQRALNNLNKAELEFPITQIEAANSTEHLKVVMDGYKNSRINYVALQTARESYLNSLNGYLDALYNYNTALINVERATHIHLIDIHHKSEHAVHYHHDELIEHITKWMNCDEKEQRKRIRKEYRL